MPSGYFPRCGGITCGQPYYREMLRILSLLLVVMVARAQDTLPPVWMKDAVIYGIKPSGFVENGTYNDITAKLPELAELGINTIWLQPVFKTHRGGQGYDVTDYFSLRDDLGTKGELKQLVNRAHVLNIRVLLDFIPNHTSIAHPYAKNIVEKGVASEYYNYYQHENDGAPYSSFYHKDAHGFIYYFWEDLVNLNYDNEVVRKMITDACVYWVKELDIDGYRFDAVWAVNARAPEFFPALRKTLKATKPGVLLLAEDKAAHPSVFKKGFDAAYDWTADTSWVSHWPWQYKYANKENHTVFNHPDAAKRYSLIRTALLNGNGNQEKVLRFMENNDLPRFINSHTLEQTKMAAAILFALPGIPLIYNGQETGFSGHPYSRIPIFRGGTTIRSQDSLGLFTFYKTLIHKRRQYSSLSTPNIGEIALEDTGSVIALHRWSHNEHLIILINPHPFKRNAVIINPQANKMYDVLSTGIFKMKREKIEVDMPAYAVRWLLYRKN